MRNQFQPDEFTCPQPPQNILWPCEDKKLHLFKRIDNKQFTEPPLNIINLYKSVPYCGINIIKDIDSNNITKYSKKCSMCITNMEQTQKN